MGLNMNSVTREYGPRYRKAPKKEKRVPLGEFTRLTGCRRKSAVRVLSARAIREVLVSTGGKTVKLKPEKNRPANRKGKRVYGDEVIASPRLFRTFFWRKRGKILAPFMRQQMEYIGQRPAFSITGETAEKLKKTSPAAIDRYLKKDRDALRVKGKIFTKPLKPLKSRIPIRAFSSGEECTTPGFR